MNWGARSKAWKTSSNTKLIPLIEMENENINDQRSTLVLNDFSYFLLSHDLNYCSQSSHKLNDPPLRLFRPRLYNLFVHNILQLIQLVHHINQHLISSTVHMLRLTPRKCMSVTFVKAWNRDGFWYGLEFLLAPADHWLGGTLCIDWLGLDVMLILLLGRLARLDCGRWMLFVCL